MYSDTTAGIIDRAQGNISAVMHDDTPVMLWFCPVVFLMIMKARTKPIPCILAGKRVFLIRLGSRSDTNTGNRILRAKADFYMTVARVGVSHR